MATHIVPERSELHSQMLNIINCLMQHNMA